MMGLKREERRFWRYNQDSGECRVKEVKAEENFEKVIPKN